MVLKKIIPVCLLCLLVLVKCLCAQVMLPSFSDTHQILSLNGKWKFKYLPGANIGADSLFYDPQLDVGAWADIKVPANWELQGFAAPYYGKNLKKGMGLYRTSFMVPANWNKEAVYLSFDGVEYGYDVWVNGKYAGSFASAYNRQVFDVSAFISVGKTNTLAVKVITQPKGFEFDTNDDWSLSGISRNVTLFSLTTVHIRDVVLKTVVTDGAAIHINAIVEKTGIVKFPPKLSFAGQLIDAGGRVVKKFTIAANAKQPDPNVVAFTTRLPVEDAHLWSAESPYLYTLRLSLKDNNIELQKYSEHIGIREITRSDGMLKLNGSPIKLKGINHHDFSPVNGRSISEAEMRQDLKIMREANINFIRTSHYPPAYPFLELCDSMGFYVMDEIPYGFGEQHLKDTGYLPVLLLRAKATVWRDKNHPCIIIWSVGNENPVTDIGLKAGRLVKSLDGTRPYCFPQTPDVFEKMLKQLPDSIDMLNDHYATAEDLKRFAPQLHHPMICGEYAHSLGLDFNVMEDVYETMYANPKMAGGAVWAFFDQGILQKSPVNISKNDFTFYAWPAPDSIYNTSTNEGADGIVYANRVPQVDYYQVRKVYTPVKILDDTLKYKSGKTDFTIELENRYDFTNLSSVKCYWKLYADTSVLDSGLIPLNCNPHNKTTAVIKTNLPAQPTANFYYLRLVVEDKNNYRFYEKTFPIRVKKNKSLLDEVIQYNISKNVLSENTVVSGSYSFELAKETGGFVLKNKDGNLLITKAPFARVGRKPTVSEVAARKKVNAKVKHTVWDPFLLTKPDAKVKVFDEHQLVVNYTYKPDSPENSFVTGDIACHFSDSGYVAINYRLLPYGKGEATQTGISFVIPKAFTEFRWVGKGPYAAYPGKDRLSEFGIFHLNSNDLYYPGNRQNVSCAVFSDSKGAGFALIAKDANITVERTAEGIIVSHNASVSGHFNKYNWPLDLFSFDSGKEIEGSFSIIPFTAAGFPKELVQIFGDIRQVAQPFQPFFHSYDQ